jgi:hypothetical protein
VYTINADVDVWPNELGAQATKKRSFSNNLCSKTRKCISKNENVYSENENVYPKTKMYTHFRKKFLSGALTVLQNRAWWGLRAGALCAQLVLL